MGCVQSRGNLLRDSRCAPRLNGAALYQVMQRFAPNVFHDEKLRTVLELPEVRRGGDMRMLNMRSSYRLALESRNALGLALRFRVKDFDRDPLFHEDMLAAVDGAHAAPRDETIHAVSLRE